MITLENLLDKVHSYLTETSLERVTRAYEYAKEAHKDQKRYSGEPYIIHPLSTAFYLADFHPDEDTLIAALLHDVSEDTPKTLAEIEAEFGPVAASLVSGMEKLSKVRSNLNEQNIENLQKMFLSMAKDLRVVLIKLCDRLHNMQTLHHVPKEKQLRIAKETLEIYAPIASRLGIYRLKSDLEDHSFAFIYPKSYDDILKQLSETVKSRDTYIAEAKQVIRQTLAREGVNVEEVDGRVKSIYSIYRKMKRKGKDQISEIFDIFAMRVILPDIYKYDKEFIGHLYTALGIMHNHFTPLAHRFKDYVAVPKVNGYRSLHTTVMGLGPKTHTTPTEVQIRSRMMHEQAEFGIASHWLYETTKGSSTLIPASAFYDASEETAEILPSPLKKYADWLKGLSKLKEEASSQEEFLQNLQVDIFQDRIFVFTPRGEVKDLPKGATPIDFAYSVHTEIGNHCIGAKVNGQIVPLNYELKNGEVVEILTKKNATPNQNWLAFVKVNHTKGRIRTWFRDQNFEKNVRAGRDLVNDVLRKFGKPPLSPDLGLLRVIDRKELTKREREELLSEVGKGMLLASTLVRKMYSFEELVGVFPRMQDLSNAPKKGEVKSSEEQVILVSGHAKMKLVFPKCCEPKKGDAIKGFVTQGKGISIHKADCPVFAKSDPSRWQEAYYVKTHGKSYHVPVAIEMEDRIGLLRDIGNAIAKLDINIEGTKGDRRENGKVYREFILCIRSYEELERLFTSLELIPNVVRAYVHAA